MTRTISLATATLSVASPASPFSRKNPFKKPLRKKFFGLYPETPPRHQNAQFPHPPQTLEIKLKNNPHLALHLSSAGLFGIIYNMITRKHTAKQVIANERLEGLKVSREAKKITDRYVAGKLSAKEAAKKIRARYGAL